MFHYRNRSTALAVAVGAALAAGALPAAADVKVYGKVHMSVDYVDGKGAGDATTSAGSAATSRKHVAVSSNSSRWGIDVSEKLGGNLKAIAKLESELDASGETSSQNSRNRYVGLNGGFGTVLAGIYDTPFKAVHNAVGFFEDQVGDYRNITDGTDQGNGTLGWNLRPGNVVAYATPNLGGFTATYAYSADSTNVAGTEDNRRRADSLSLVYAQGPLYVGYGYETHRFSTVADGGNPTEKGQRLAASYNFGAFKLAALVQDLKDLGGTASGSQSVNRKSWTVGGAYTAGNNVFKAQYTKAGNLSNQSAGTSGDNTGAKLWALGWDHLFSKTVKAYVAYAKTDNDSAAAFRVNSTGHGDAVTPATGLDPQAWSVGMIVDF
ncbi:MAG: porin [Gammaproteobacteria bacterium]|nr:MAG: porin [Gammaproteobacteria bacterium]